MIKQSKSYTYPDAGQLDYKAQEKVLHSLTEKSFEVIQPFCYMQRGLPAAYTYADYLFTNQFLFVTRSQGRKFIEDLTKIIFQFHQILIPHQKTSGPEKHQIIQNLIVVAFDQNYWKWLTEAGKNDCEKIEDSGINPYPKDERGFYKYNMKILIQIKRNSNTGSSKATQRLKTLFKDHIALGNQKATFEVIQGESKNFCKVPNSILGGRFNDNVELPKDPYSFYLHSLIGYEDPAHLGGSYLFAQKSYLDWQMIHNSNEGLPSIIGRNDINNGSTIFSQGHCPHSHITSSRVKDDNGNPITLFRESKSFTIKGEFDANNFVSTTDNIPPEQGIFFLGYSKSVENIKKIIASQYGDHPDFFRDGLLNLFHPDSGNILYVPNAFELYRTVLYINENDKCIKKLCHFHQTDFGKNFPADQIVEEDYNKNKNFYYSYSRNSYLQKMASAYYIPERKQDLNPPSPRMLRLVTKTFALWQDTWYHDRRQVELGDLKDFIFNKEFEKKQEKQLDKELNRQFYENIQKQILADLKRFGLAEITSENYADTPFALRNGLSINVMLGHLLSSERYGGRGPSKFHKHFGANTFHLEAEDILAGGEANLTFGQGKHLLRYLTEEERTNLYKMESTITQHSGIGHVTAFLDQVFDIGLEGVIKEFEKKIKQYENPKFLQYENNYLNQVYNLKYRITEDPKDLIGKEQREKRRKYFLFVSTALALRGMQRYFQNYAALAKRKAEQTKVSQVASRNSFEELAKNLSAISRKAPENLTQGAQLALSVFICLHITGEPVSIGRLDHELSRFISNKSTYDINKINQEHQDIIDCFWIKVGEKVSFNKSFFEDHQKYGNLAMTGQSSAYPQGASFNQWGHQLTIGGTHSDGTPAYNYVTLLCLRAARTIPFNAPCLGLRLTKRILDQTKDNQLRVKKDYQIFIEEASKALMSGGAHPILLHEEKIIDGFVKCGGYKIKIPDIQENTWKTQIKKQHQHNFTSDGCYEYLIVGRCWFALAFCNGLLPLDYVLNEGCNSISSGPQFINGARQFFLEKPITEYKTYKQFEDEVFKYYKLIFSKSFELQIKRHGAISQVCPATLLNGFTATLRERQWDFYENGSEYRFFCPQIQGVANFVNAMWNIKTLVFQKQLTNLKEVRFMLLTNWGDQDGQPFYTTNLPKSKIQRLKERAKMLRDQCWSQKKFGIDVETKQFGNNLAKRMSKEIFDMFENPSPQMLKTLKFLTLKFGSKKAPFGFQVMPGCGTFENYFDSGAMLGASFDGRKKFQTISEDFSPQPYHVDWQLPIPNQCGLRQWPSVQFGHVLSNYTDPDFSSGSVVDFNINENFGFENLQKQILKFTLGEVGPNLITVTVADREKMQSAKNNNERDLLRFRMGGWTEFAVAMFRGLLEQHIRRLRTTPTVSLMKPLSCEKANQKECKICQKKCQCK